MNFFEDKKRSRKTHLKIRRDRHMEESGAISRLNEPWTPQERLALCLHYYEDTHQFGKDGVVGLTGRSEEGFGKQFREMVSSGIERYRPTVSKLRSGKPWGYKDWSIIHFSSAFAKGIGNHAYYAAHLCRILLRLEYETQAELDRLSGENAGSVFAYVTIAAMTKRYYKPFFSRRHTR